MEQTSHLLRLLLAHQLPEMMTTSRTWVEKRGTSTLSSVFVELDLTAASVSRCPMVETRCLKKSRARYYVFLSLFWFYFTHFQYLLWKNVFSAVRHGRRNEVHPSVT